MLVFGLTSRFIDDARYRRPAALLLAAGALALTAAAAVAVDGLRDDARASDVGIVLGSKVMPDGTPSPRLRARLDKAGELYRQGKFGWVIVSGGTGKEGYSEAKVMAAYLADRYAVPRGAILYVTPWVLHRDARWWAAPQEFRPERFLPGAPEVPRGAYLPFGVGPRVCIGQHFAMLEMTIVAAMLLRRFELALPAGAPAVPETVLNVTLRPRGGVWLGLRRR